MISEYKQRITAYSYLIDSRRNVNVWLEIIAMFSSVNLTNLCSLISEKKQSKATVPNFTVRRSFTLLNSGELPFYVHGYSINKAPCEGYGFKVLECEGYEMKPNTSRKIDIT